MATKTERKVPKVIHGTQPASTTAQTPGMERRPAIDWATVGASKIGSGPLLHLPITRGPPHQHGEAETAAYVISGHVRVYYGEDFKEWIEAGPGDYIFVPANFWHIEENPCDEPSEQFLARGPDNIVINMDQ